MDSVISTFCRRQFVEEARRDRGRPGAVNAAVGGKVQFGAAAGARQPDMGEAALFLQPGAALFVERALARKQAFLPARQEHVVEFEPLGRMQRHQRHRFVVGAAVAVHHQRDVFEETLQVLELLHRANQLFQVVQPSSSVGRTVLLPHFGVTALVEDDFGQFGMRRDLALRAPAIEMQDQVAQARRAPSVSTRRFQPRRGPPRTAEYGACARGRAASARWRRRARAWAR